MTDGPGLPTIRAVRSVDEQLDDVARLRREVAGLLSAIDTGELPRPDRIRTGEEPGADWRPAHGVRVFTIDTPDCADVGYVTGDDWHYGMPGDWESFSVPELRRLGLACLAAADWVEQHRGQVPRLDVKRARRGTERADKGGGS